MRRPAPPQPAQIPCTDCTRTFSRRPDLNRHLQEVHQKVTFPCDYPGCDYSSTRKDRTRKHRENKHPGYFTQVMEIDNNNTTQNQGQANYPNSQTSAQEYPSFQSQPSQTYNDWSSTPESTGATMYTTTVSHNQQMYYSGPDPSMPSYQTATATSSYGNDWELEKGQEQWNSGNGHGPEFP